MMQPQAHSGEVKRRRVHYFSGFDPRGAAWYHRLTQQEASKPQPQGGQLAVGRRRKRPGGLASWSVQWRAHPDEAHAQVVTEHVFMGWDDVIRTYWSRSPWALLQEFFRTYQGIGRDVTLSRPRAVSRTAFLTGILPAVYLLGTALLMCVLAGLGQAAVVKLAPAHAIWGVLAIWALAGAGLAALWAYGARKGLFWLLRIFHFIICMGRGPIKGLEAKTKAWVEQMIQAQQADPVDEVVLVGHSVGTLVMVDAVKALLDDPRWQQLQGERKTLLLTLGQCYPFVAMVPQAQAFRATLQHLCTDPRLMWVDVTARIDPLCFYNAHPLVKTGIPHHDTANPKLYLAKFFHMYETSRWQQIKQDKLLTHFLYLMTPDKVGNFMLMDVLYSPKPFAQHWSE